MTNRDAYICFKARVPVLMKLRDDLFEREYKIVSFSETIPKRKSNGALLEKKNRYAYTFTVEDEQGNIYHTTANNLTSTISIDESAVFFPIFQFAE